MRTKVERNCRRTGQQKVNISLPSPKVVLNADDCARFLDSMGKGSVLVVEKEGKTVTATSRASSVQSSSASTSFTASSLCSSSSLSKNVNSTLGAATQTKMCKNWVNLNSADSSKFAESSADPAHTKIPSTQSAEGDHQGISMQTRTILKPPKKRRGIDKKFEDVTPIPLNNGDTNHAVVSIAGELVAAETPPMILPSHLDVIQKYSVEQLLQHQPGSLVSASNNQTLISGSYSHDSRSHISSLNDLPSLSPNKASVTLPLSLSANVDDYTGRAAYASQLYTHPYSTTIQPSQNHTYRDHTSSGECSPSLPLSHLVLANKTMMQSGSFQHLPEQVEPMNLSTSCKPAVGLVSLQVSSTSESQTAEDVSELLLQKKSLALGFTESTNSLSFTVSESSNLIFDNNNTKAKNPMKKPPETAQDMPFPAGLCSELHIIDPSFQNNVSDCESIRENCGKETAQVSESLVSSVDSDLSHRAISAASIKVPHKETESFLLSQGSESQAVEMSSGEHVETNVCSQVEQSTQSLSSLSPTQSSELQIPKTMPPPSPSQDSQTVCTKKLTKICKESSTAIETITVKKTKRLPKKKVEIPMDEVSCADRLHRYSLTIDDVIANFVYVPEPIEDFLLTEEEEAVIRDQFENVHDSSSTENTDIHSAHCQGANVIDIASTTSQADAQNGHDMSSVGNESLTTVRPPKKRPTAVVAENFTESCQNVQKTAENIDSVLAFVAGDLSNLTPPVESNCIDDSSTKKQKKLKKKSSEDTNKKEESKQIKVKKESVSSEVHNQQNTDSVGELTGSCTENSAQKNVIVCSEGSQAEVTEKVSKPKKIKKRKSDTEVTPVMTQTSTPASEVDGMAEDEVNTLSKKKIVDGKVRTPKKKKTDNKQLVPLANSITSQAVFTTDKEAVVPNRAETSDIGESIASTSGGSEQDTSVHEPESKDEMTSTDPQMTDKENQDTGLESGGDDKPVRRYKKRLDFVKCDQCDHQARGRSALSRHMKKVHMLDVVMPFRCEHCDYGCTKMASLNRHLFTHGVYPCSRCSFVADERVKLSEHTVEQHKDKLDVKMCKVCNRYIKCGLITIEQHTLECQGPTPFRCTECEKEFKYASSLRVHYHTHFPDQPKRFKCEHCDYRTNYKANLHKHQKNMHASRDRDIQCPECGKLFSTEDNMRRHRKVHTLARPFTCGTCEKSFKTSGALKGHQLIHTATRPYTCNIPGCNRNFRTPKFLKSHQEEFHRLIPKKFFCSVEGCTYSFFKRSHLKRHAITHTGERNFHCTWPGCSKSFRHADNLKVHFRSHTNEKPVQCQLCDFKCKQKNSLFLHKRRVHQIIDMSVCPRLKSSVTETVQKKVKTISDVDGAEYIRVTPSVAENAAETFVLEAPPDVKKTVEELPSKCKVEDSTLVSEEEVQPEMLSYPAPIEHSSKILTVIKEEQGPLDLYEFKSDEESGEDTPSSFRRDKNLMNALTPLPPPPKELLRKNEIQEMKEKEKKEKEERREQERKEKAERKEQEKNEKVEKKNLEKQAKAERKEMEKKEKMQKKELDKKERVEKKELEKKEKVEKKELEKKEKLEHKELEKKEKIEKKQQEKKEKIEKKEQEKKEKAERKEREKKERAEKKVALKTSVVEKAEDVENNTDCEEKIKSASKRSPSTLKRRKSPVSAASDEPITGARKPIRDRKNLREGTSEKSKSETPLKVKEDENVGASSPKRKMVSTKKRKESGETTCSVTSLSSLRNAATKVKSAALKRNHVRRCKRKGKLTPPKRKPSARIKARIKAMAVETKSVMKGQKSSKPGLKKKKSVWKKGVATIKEIKEVEQEDIDTDDVNIETDDHKRLRRAEETQAPSEESKVLLKSSHEETLALPIRPSSPASSDEIMLQGKASPYRDFSDDENLEEQTKRPGSSLSQKQPECPDAQERFETEADLSQYEQNDECTMDRHTSHPAEEYSDDEVSNDIPLTPPRAPAPPPVESSEDELEPEPEPAPFSVPGPNTPFSVPGPNTPFSIPPPTNLMQQHSVHSEEAPMSAIPSVPSMEMHSQSSVDMQQSLESVEMHPHGSVEMNNSHGSVEMHHPQGSVEIPHSHSSVEIRSHNPLEMRSHGSVEMVQPHGSVEMMCCGSISESMPHSEQHVRTPESVMRDISNTPLSDKYELPQSLQEQTQASDADKEYFDQYLRSLSAANNRAANGGLEPSPSGLQQLEAMVGKSHLDLKEMSSKSPISCLPTSVITSLESTLPLLTHGDLRARMDALVSDRHHESLYTRDTPSSLSRLPDRQTPLPPSAMGHSPAFDAFSSLNSLHPAAASGTRENAYLRQTENLFPTPPGTSSFMAEAMFQRQAMTTPFLPPQPSDRSSLSRIPDATPLRSSSSSSLLRRSGAVPGPDMFSPPTMAQGMPRHPFANAWASQEVRPAHWQAPYLSHQPNVATTGSFFPTKDNYLTGREFMFDPSIRPSTERSMFPTLSSQSQDSFQLDRFDLSNYFPNAMTPYGSSTGSLEYSRSAHATAAKPFDDRYRQTAAASAAIPDFRGLPPTGGSSDMFSGLSGVNTGFNIYTGNPMSYHAQHVTDNVNSAFLTHSTSAQHAMFERDYAAAAAHRSFYPQNSPYPFVDERQYPGTSKLAHAHAVAPTPAPQERNLMSRSAASESQMQDPYRSLLYRY